MMDQLPQACENHTIEMFDIRNPELSESEKRYFVMQHYMFYDACGVGRNEVDHGIMKAGQYAIIFFSPKFDRIIKYTSAGDPYPEAPLPCETRFGPFASSAEAVDYWNDVVSHCREHHKALIGMINQIFSPRSKQEVLH